MASKRKLKKEIVELSSKLFSGAIIIRAFTEPTKQAPVEELMDDIMIWTDDSLRRAAHPDGKDNPKLVKTYYRKLREDLAEKFFELDERLTGLVEHL